jgi:hemoglobin
MKDIETTDDVKTMVDSFYDRVNKDEMLSPVFNGVAAVNWEAHLPVMYGFWSNILFSTGEYNGRPFQKHAPLPINDAHFERWLQLFNQNLDENFEGPKTEIARFRAKTIGAIFSGKMHHMKKFN